MEFYNLKAICLSAKYVILNKKILLQPIQAKIVLISMIKFNLVNFFTNNYRIFKNKNNEHIVDNLLSYGYNLCKTDILSVIKNKKNKFNYRKVKIISLEFLKWLLNNNLRSKYIFYSVAKGGNIECIKYCKEHEFKWSEIIGIYLARSGNLESLKYAIEDGCTYNKNYICCYAARAKTSDCLKYLHFEKKCLWNKYTCEEASQFYSIINSNNFNSSLIGYSWTAKSLECLKFLHENNCPWDESVIYSASKNGNFECMKYAHKNGLKLNDEHLCNSIYSVNFTKCNLSSLQCVKYCYNHGVILNKFNIISAIEVNSLDILKYLFKKNCPFNSEILCSIAAKYNSLDCLKYLHEKGYKWNEKTCKYAAKYGRIKILKYLHQNNCPWDNMVSLAAVSFYNGMKNKNEKNKIKCIRYLIKSGCSYDKKDLLSKSKNLIKKYLKRKFAKK